MVRIADALCLDYFVLPTSLKRDRLGVDDEERQKLRVWR